MARSERGATAAVPERPPPRSLRLVLPTYQGIEDIERALRVAHAALAGCGLEEPHVLVVDDSAQGYGFQFEVTDRAIRAGFEVVEVPIVFRDRNAGTSKMSPRIAVEAFLLVPHLRARPRR